MGSRERERERERESQIPSNDGSFSRAKAPLAETNDGLWGWECVIY